MNDRLQAAYQSASKRLLLLDYDGTLVDFKDDPRAAVPSPRVLDVLGKLTADQHNSVVIVSGRDQLTLEAWLGELPLTLAAEHGSFVKRPGQAWAAVTTLADEWKQPAQAIVAEFVKTVPGTFVEAKASALVWHYRTANDPAQAAAAAASLVRELSPLAQAHDLRATPGNMIVELRPAAVDKGKIAQHWISEDTWDFVLAAGDDTTDEDMFAALPATAFSIKVGSGLTRARVHSASPRALRQLLETLAAAA